MKTNKKNIYFKLFLLIFLVFLPWSISDYQDNITPEKITSDLSFYEINTCSISLNEFLIHNANVVYQDHYKIRYNNYSSIECFGRITGIDQINDVFYISIGTNSIVNLFLQTFGFILLLSFFKSNHGYKLKISNFAISLLTSLFFCVLIYSESRFYVKNLFLFDLTIFPTYLNLVIYFFALILIINYFIGTREDQLINFVPIFLLCFGLYSGLNFYFLHLAFVPLGIFYLLNNKKKYLLYFLVIAISFWSYKAISLNFYLDPDKIRGGSNTSFNFLSVLNWSVLSFLTFMGCVLYFKENIKYFRYKLFSDSFLITSSLIFLMGILSSNFPFFNFLSYYYFGLTKFPTTNNQIFLENEWGEKVAWRGILPSAETAGEIYGFTVLIFFIYMLNKSYKFKLYHLLTVFPFFGLLASNNKAAIVTLTFCTLLVFNNKYKFKNNYKYLLFLIPITLLIYFIRFENVFLSFDFSSSSLVNTINAYSLDYNLSSSYLFFNTLDSTSILGYLFILLSQVALYINRSELWAMFFARYNPDLQEFLFGSGPFSLSKLYGEINILPYKIGTGQAYGFLLPHSSLLLLLLFFGLIGASLISIFLIIKIIKTKKQNYNSFVLLLFLGINLLKSDSILYLPYLILLIFAFSLFDKLTKFK